MKNTLLLLILAFGLFGFSGTGWAQTFNYTGAVVNFPITASGYYELTAAGWREGK